MIVLGCDLGNKSRNSLAVMDENSKLLYYIYLSYNTKDYKTPFEYRMTISNVISGLIAIYKIDYLIYERINLFRGQGVSPLANIISMCKLQTTLINNLSDYTNICDIDVRSWKSKVLGTAKATKEDSVNYVRKYYPEVDLDIKVEHPRKKETEIITNHDLADAVCIAKYGIIVGKNVLDSHKVNYQ